MNKMEKLLIEITRCPEFQGLINSSESDHPCFKIVNSQCPEAIDNYQVPEPWSGHIESAPILFVASNPSISDHDIFPTCQWSDDDIVDFFIRRYGGGKKKWITDGTKALGKYGYHLRATNFWAAIKQRAIELKNSTDIKPGIHYAVTEIVHCKSKSEIGMREAQDTCVEHYLNRIMKLSVASIIVVLGTAAQETLRKKLNISDGITLHGPTDLYGRDRIVTFLPHPNARTHRSFANVLMKNDLQTMRAFLPSMK